METIEFHLFMNKMVRLRNRAQVLAFDLEMASACADLENERAQLDRLCAEIDGFLSTRCDHG